MARERQNRTNSEHQVLSGQIHKNLLHLLKYETMEGACFERVVIYVLSPLTTLGQRWVLSEAMPYHSKN